MSERFPGVDWYCDRCNAYLNSQSGFDDNKYTWKCEACGHKNSISGENVYESHDAYRGRDSDAFDTSDYDLIRSMKRDDSYRFSYPFEYIIERVGDEDSDEYVLGETTISVQLDWVDNGNDAHQAPGYQVSYAVYNYADIPASFNGTEREIFDQKWFDVQNDLAASGIDVRAVESF